MKILKNKDLLLNIISIVIIIAALLFWLWPKKKQIQKTIPKTIAFSLKPKKIMYVQKISKAPSYNYQNLLSLMDECRKIERHFYSNFYVFTKDVNNLNYLKETLKYLLNERGFFKKYVKKSKIYHKRSVPSRKRDSQRYYFRVLEDSIDEIKKMIGKFNLYLVMKKS